MPFLFIKCKYSNYKIKFQFPNGGGFFFFEDLTFVQKKTQVLSTVKRCSLLFTHTPAYGLF
jgi:hypothetical protein